jgi:hypothetical protein
LAELADHPFVTVTARITAVDLTHEGTTAEWATLTLTDDNGLEATARAYSVTWKLIAGRVRPGVTVTLSGETATDMYGTFFAVHTLHEVRP